MEAGEMGAGLAPFAEQRRDEQSAQPEVVLQRRDRSQASAATARQSASLASSSQSLSSLRISFTAAALSRRGCTGNREPSLRRRSNNCLA
jgi:hypothetical protein